MNAKLKTKRAASKTSYKKGDATRESILVAARCCFNSEGIANVTCRTIAKQAGLSAGNVYYYFANKDVILTELRVALEHAIAALLTEMEQKRLNETTARRDAAKQWLGVVWDWRFLFLDINQLIRTDPKSRPVLMAIRQRSIKLHTELYEEHWARQGLTLTESDHKFCHDLAASNWILTVHGVQYVALDREDGEATREDFEDAINQFQIAGRIIFDRNLQKRLGQVAEGAERTLEQ